MALSDFLTLLLHLPVSYAGPTRSEPAPHAVVGVGEGTLAAQLVHMLVGGNFTHSGTQFVFSSADAADAARTYAELAEVAGAAVRRVSTGGQVEDVDVLIPGGALATYHFAQYFAHATGHHDAAQEAEKLLSDIAGRCHPAVEEGNPARDLAWRLWGRSPLLLAAPDADALPHAWQNLLARMGKTLGVPVLGDPLPFVTGAFEAQHERGDGRIALILGDADAALQVVSEVLESRIDEVVYVPYPQEAENIYASHLSLWYFGAWVAFYLAERYGQQANDPPMLARAQAVLAGQDRGESLTVPREESNSRRTALEEDEEWDGPDDESDDENDDL